MMRAAGRNPSSGALSPAPSLIHSVRRQIVEGIIQPIPGQKVLILDERTTGIVSLVLSQSQLLSYLVLMVDKLVCERRCSEICEPAPADPWSNLANRPSESSSTNGLDSSVPWSPPYKSSPEVHSTSRCASLDLMGMDLPSGLACSAHLKAIYYVSASAENINHLVQELRSARRRFLEMHIFLVPTGAQTARSRDLQRLANADRAEAVRQVQIVYLDIFAISPFVFSLELPQRHVLGDNASDAMHLESSLHHTSLRISEGLASALFCCLRGEQFNGIYFSSKRGTRPSALTESVARHMARYFAPYENTGASQPVTNPGDTKSPSDAIYQGTVSSPLEPLLLAGGRCDDDDSLLPHHRGSGPFAACCPGRGTVSVLLFERSSDPISPLLTQWTYEAMVNELLGLDRNRVHVPGEGEVVLSHTEDEFWAERWDCDFGEIGAAVSRLMMDYRVAAAEQRANEEAIHSTSLERLPAVARQGHNAAKHVAIVHALSARVETNRLMDQSRIEQRLAVGATLSTDELDMLRRLLTDVGVSLDQKLRLALLASARQTTVSVEELTAALGGAGAAPAQVEILLRHFQTLCGPTPPPSSGLLKLFVRHVARRSGGGLHADLPLHAFKQHVSDVARAAAALARGDFRCPDAALQLLVSPSPSVTYPTPDPSAPDSPPPGLHTIMIFIIGGATFQETVELRQVERQAVEAGTPVRFWFGGTRMLRAKSFIESLALDSITRRSIVQSVSSPTRSANSSDSESAALAAARPFLMHNLAHRDEASTAGFSITRASHLISQLLLRSGGQR